MFHLCATEIAASPEVSFYIGTLTTAFVIYMLAGQMARAQDMGFGEWPSIILVLGVFLICQVINHRYPELAIGTALSYVFPTVLALFPSARK